VQYVLLRGLLNVIFRVLWRPRITGVERIPPSGPVIIASNHLSFIDSVVLPLSVPRRVRFLAKSDYFTGTGLRGALVAWWFRSMDTVPVDRGNNQDAMASLKAAMGVLEDGHCFGIYPEGTRSRDGRMYKGRTGVGWLALESGATVVPVTLIGTDQVQPVGRRIPRVRPVQVLFGEPVDPAPWIERTRGKGGAGKARREITDEVMARISAMSPQVQAGVFNERQPD